MINILFSADKVVHGLNRDENFGYTVSNNPAILPAVTDEVNVTGDATWIFNQTEATLDNRAIAIIPSFPDGNYIYSVVNGEPYVVTDGSGNILSAQEKYAIANGSIACEISISSDIAGTKRYETIISPPQNYTIDFEFQSFDAGSLGDHITKQMEAMVVGHTANTNAAQTYWNTNNGDADNPIAVLNPTRFCAGIDISGHSAIRDNQPDDHFPVTLISDRHIIGADHAKVALGEKVVFQKNNGDFVSATVDVISDLIGGDTYVGLLSAPVTDANLKHFKLMPQHWEYAYAPALHQLPMPASQNATITSVPTLDKRMHNTDGVVANWVGINGIKFNKASKNVPENEMGGMSVQPIVNPVGLSVWSKIIIPGDSGSPSFHVINGEPILIACNNGGAGANNSFSNLVPYINEAMNEVSGVAQGTYAVEHPNLSMFRTYN